MPAARVQTNSESSPFVKQLASSDRTIRDNALSSLRTYLRQRSTSSASSPFTELELLKLWKGLHYSMFMSDKPRNQQRLARDLADLCDVFEIEGEKAKQAREGLRNWFAAFWKTMSREWGGIDGLRMDKYLYLVRCYVNKGFNLCQRLSWDAEFVEVYLGMLQAEGGPLTSRDSKVAVGVQLHTLDIWVDEFAKVDGDKAAPVESIMAPLRQLQKETLVKSVRQRAREGAEDERIQDGRAWRPAGEDVEEKGDADFGGFED